MNMMEQALAYARMGWAVFPLAPGMKIPISGSRGFKDATKDAATIIAWWTANPTANIGIATGKASGIWVADVDMKKGKNGAESLRVFAAGFPEQSPPTKTAHTPSGGLHLYLAYDERTPVGNRADVLVGVDIRGDGGYVVAPPSRTAGGVYAWSEDADATPAAVATSFYAALPTHQKEPRLGVGQGRALKRETSRSMPWDLAIDTQRDGNVALDATAVGQKYVCRCPFHEDRTRSAFFCRKTENYGFLYCSACDVSWATEEKPNHLTNRIAAISARLQEIEDIRNGKQR